MARHLGVPVLSRTVLEELPAETILAAQEAVTVAGPGSVGGQEDKEALTDLLGSGIRLPWAPWTDGDVVTEEPLQAAASPQQSDVSLLAGATAHEFNMAWMTASWITSDMVAEGLARAGVPAQLAAAYLDRPGQPPCGAVGQAITDRTFIDPDSYRHVLAGVSCGIFDAKRQQRLVRPQQLLPSRGVERDAADAAARYPVLIAAAFYTAADEDLDFLIGYAQARGHLVVGPRTGYGDEEGRARTQRAPARVADAAGVWYDEMVSLPSPVPVHGSLRGAATGFAGGLVASDAEVLARYQHPHLGRWAAVTTRPTGPGSAGSRPAVGLQAGARAGERSAARR